MAKKITTLFIRDGSVHVAVTDGMRVEKWATSPLEPGLVSQGLIVDEAKVAAAIRDLFKQNQIRPGRVVAGISGVNSLYRMITLPEMPDTLLAEAVRREARRVLPVSLDELNLSYQTIPSVSKGENRLFLATYPKNTTEAMIRTLRQAGLDPYILDLAPLALSRVPDEPRCIIVNARAGHADIIVVEDRLPQLIRVLSLPSDAKSIAEKLPAVTEELNRTVVFYNSSHSEKPLNQSVPLFVCGELAENQSSWEQLVGRQNFPVALLPNPMEHGEDFQANDFMVNIGLALKELAAERGGTNFSTVNLNILPVTYQPKKVAVSSVLLPVLAVVGIGLVAYMASFVYRSRSDTALLREEADRSEAPIAQQTQRIAALKAEVAKTTPLSAPIEAQVAQLNATAGTFRTTMSSLKSKRAKIDEDMSKRVVGLLPADKTDLSLTSVSHDGSVIQVTGTAELEDYIFAYTRKLRESGGVSAVVITSITKDEIGYSYTVMVK